MMVLGWFNALSISCCITNAPLSLFHSAVHKRATVRLETAAMAPAPEDCRQRWAMEAPTQRP